VLYGKKKDPCDVDISKGALLRIMSPSPVSACAQDGSL